MREGGGLCWGPSGRVVAHRLPKPWQLFVITTVDLTMAALNKLIHALQAYPSVQCSLNTNQLFLFIDLCCHLRQELLYTPGSSLAIPPLRLPDNIRQFLVLCLFPSKTSNCLSIIDDCWKALSRIIWATHDRVAAPSMLDFFLKYGVELSLCE